MPDYKIEWTQREYTCYSTSVKAKSPREALKLFLANPQDYDANDQGFTDAPKGHPRSGPIMNTAECVGTWVPFKTRNLNCQSLKEFKKPVKMPVCILAGRKE